MKHILIASAALVLALSPLRSQTPEEILNKHGEAIGGAKAFQAVTTQKIVGKLFFAPINQTMDMIITRKRPNQSRLEITNPEKTLMVSQVTDGTTAWQINSMIGMIEPTSLPGPAADTINRDAYMDDLYFGTYKSRGVSLESKGSVEEEGKKYHQIQATYKDGHIQQRFYSDETGLLYKVVQNRPTGNGVVEATTVYSDYRQVEGLKFPFKIDGSLGAAITIETVSLNVDVDDALFQMPKKP